MATDYTDGRNSGVPEHTGLDEAGRQAILSRLEERQPTVGGNYADLQRAGAEAASNGSKTLGEGVELPPGIESSDEVQTPSEADTKQGLITRENVRTGDADELIKAQEEAAVPADETDKPKETASKKDSK